MEKVIFIEKAVSEDAAPTSIRDLYKRVETLFKTQPEIEREIQVQISSIVSQLYHSALNNEEGYCYKFSLPIVMVNSIFKKIKTAPKQVEECFRNDWKYPKNTHMYSDSYYHILLLMLYHGLKTNNKTFINGSLLIILIKIWNGRRQEFLPYCNPSIMKYVVQNMLSGKFHASKYDSPLQLLANYFVPTLLKKYGSEIASDPVKLKNIFMQSYSRIYQMFINQPKVNPQTGEKKATGGLATLYYKAHNEGATSRDVRVKADEDNETTFDQYGSTHNVDEIVTSVTDYIVLNKQESYPEGFVKQLNRLTHVSSKVINNLAVDIHSPDYHDLIQDLLTLMLSRLNIREKSDICSSQFILDIKKKIISSKNNADSQKIVKIVDTLLTKLFKTRGLSFERYSVVQRIQIRTVLIHIFVFNLKKVICHQQAAQQFNFLAKLNVSDII